VQSSTSLLTIYSVPFLLLYTIYSPDFASASYAAAPLVPHRYYARLLGLVPRRSRVPRRPCCLTHKCFDPPYSLFPHHSSTAEYLAGAGPLAQLYAFDSPRLRAWMVHWFVTAQNANHLYRWISRRANVFLSIAVIICYTTPRLTGSTSILGCACAQRRCAYSI
jgi:hypothetical protein